MKALKLASLVTISTLTLMLVSVLAVSARPATSGALRSVGAAAAQAFSATRPAAENGVGAAATGFLPTIQITIGSPVRLLDKLQLTGDVTIACGPFISLDFSFASYQLSEASGHTVSHAFGSIPALICDGAPHTFAASLVGQDVPFRPGTGVAQVFANACGLTPNFTSACVSGNATSEVAIKK